jgi:hypothetical protein
VQGRGTQAGKPCARPAPATPRRDSGPGRAGARTCRSRLVPSESRDRVAAATRVSTVVHASGQLTAARVPAARGSATAGT